MYGILSGRLLRLNGSVCKGTPDLVSPFACSLISKQIELSADPIAIKR